ncbi:G5 domain-containing protein, partial [Corynebacterium riegelii]|uniref:G5 domain-containing protein n=1 Tax=Corynebacterium riegelii TaxID=156976 RepID=UPI002889797E
APADAKPGTQVKIPVTVTYEDGSTDIAYAVVNVLGLPTREEPFKVEYKYDDTIPAGEYKVETKGEPGAAKMHKDGTWEQTKAPVNEVVVIGTKPAESAKDVTWKFPIPYPTEVRENPDLKPGETRVVQEGENGEKTYTAKFTSKGSEAQVAEEETTKKPVTRIIEVGPGIPDQELTSKKTQEVPFEIEYVYDDTLESGQQVVDEEGVPGEQTITSTQKIKDGKPDGEPSINIEQTKAPKKAKIRIGTKTTGENTETYKAEAPYKVVVKYDPNMPAGESKVTTKGEPGEKTVTIKRDITNSKPGEPQITEEITKKPVDEVITVGTKPSEASEKVTWTAQVPFDVETRPNPELKPGEIKVVQEGVPGEKTYTANFASKGDQATVTPEEKQTKDPVNQIIEYGPAAEDTSVVTKVEKPVPFETEIVFDNTLKEGEQVVDEQGELGTEVVTSTQKIVDGKPSGEPTVTSEQTKAPKNAKIRVGTKTTGSTTETVESEVPFGVKIEFDPNLPAGTSETVTEGKPGKKKVTIERDITNSKPGEPKISEEITEEPVDQVIKVGTKPSEASKKVTWTAQVPFDVETRPNPELKPGEIKVVQEGVPGEKTYTADFTAKGDQASVKPEEKQTKDPVNEIIEYGPAAEDTSVVTKVEKPVPFETEIVFDNTLKEGEQVVDEQGELGTEVVTSTQKIVDGKPSGNPEVTSEQTKAPKNAKIRVGTKTTGETKKTVESEVPFGVKIEFDPNLPAGTSEVVTEGKPGKKTTTVTQKVTNSQPDGEATVEEKVTEEPVDQVIKVGTKPSETSEKVEWKAQIPFEVETRPNPELKPGEIKVVQKGKPGEKTYAADFTSKGNDSSVTPEEKLTKDPVKEIIEYGPAIEDGEIVTKVKKPVPFETEIVFDDTLEYGKQKVDQQGELGEDVETSKQKIVDGKPSGDPEVTNERTKEPVKQIIRVGTKKPAAPDPSPEAKIVELPFTTEIIYDENLEPGTEVVDQEGQNGEVEVTVENGQPSVKTTKEPVKRIVRVGTKPPAGHEWKERIPFEVKVKLDPTIPAGEHKVEQEGKPGLVQHNSDGTEETLVEKQDHVILIGTKPADPTDPGQPEQPTPEGELDINVRYTTRIVYDPNLKPGEEVEDVAGKDGKYRIKVVDGQPVAEMVEKPVERVLRVGTKPPAGTSWTEEISYDYEVVEDSELEAGKHEIVQPGKPGERIHREDGSVVEKAPQKLIIKVGTKKKTDEPTPPADPDNKKGSSEKAERCVANAFATNSPLLWMLPIGLLAGIGYGVNEAFGPQIQAASAEINARFQENMPQHDWGVGGHGQRRQDPEWMRELQAKADGINRQFAGYSEQLQPLGIALGVIASLALLGSLIAQACTEEGFDNGMTVWGLKGGSSEPGKRPKEWSSQQ